MILTVIPEVDIFPPIYPPTPPQRQREESGAGQHLPQPQHPRGQQGVLPDLPQPLQPGGAGRGEVAGGSVQQSPDVALSPQDTEGHKLFPPEVLS